MITYNPIGVIHSPFTDPTGMPIQPTGARGVKGKVEVFPEYAEGLKDLDGFSHIILLYHFDRTKGYKLVTKPFLEDELHGVFAMRAPRRPNPIGLSVVRLVELTSNMLKVEDIDVLDGTPLLDIKPFVPQFDSPTVERLGWLDKNLGRVKQIRSDDRFSSPSGNET